MHLRKYAKKTIIMETKMHKKLIIFTAYATILMLGIYISLYQYTILKFSQLFLLNAAVMGLMIGIQHFGMAIPPLFLGVLSGKIGKKKVIVISYGLIVIGTALIGSVQSVFSFFASIFFIGAGFAVAEATLSAVLADEFPDSSTRHLNFSQVAFSCGALSGPVIAAGLISGGVYFQHLYLYCAVIFLVLGGIFMFTKHQNDNGKAQCQSIPTHIKGFLRNRVLMLLAVGIFLYVGLENTIANFTDSYFELTLRTPELSAVALSFFWGAMIPSRFLAGIIKMNVRKMFVFLTALVFTGAIAAMLVPQNMLKIVLFALCGFGCGPIWPLMMDTAVKKNRGSAGPVLNIMFSFCAMGGALLPMLAGVIVNRSNETAAYYLSASATVVMLAVYLKSLKD